MKKIFLTLIGAAVFALAPGTAEAVPIVATHSSNQGITNLSYSVVGTTVTINETWGAAGPGVLLISGLDDEVAYTVVRNITNNSGVDWTRLAHELLDPAGNANDVNDVTPYPSFVPSGYTTSNDSDGLSFAQGGNIPRTSTAFNSVVADEFSDARDFLDFFNGTGANGAVFSVTFGLTDLSANLGVNQPFLLFQRPNVSSVPEIPEPTTMVLLGTGLAGVGARIRKRRQNGRQF